MGVDNILHELFFLNRTDRHFINNKLITDYGFQFYELALLSDADLVELLDKQKSK